MGILAASTLLFVLINLRLKSYSKKLSLRFVRPETWFELVCLVYGWVLLGAYPILAPFRYLRILRVAWDYEFYFCNPDSYTHAIAAKVVFYMESVARELGSATATKGGLIVLGMFFFLTYMFATIFFAETTRWQNWAGNPGVNPPWWVPGSNAIPCDTLTHCYITLMRLCFYDGNGFDFMTNMANSPDPALFALMLLYMCLGGILLFNGLIGIYGGAFVIVEEKEEPKDALPSDVQTNLDTIKGRLVALPKKEK